MRASIDDYFASRLVAEINVADKTSDASVYQKEKKRRRELLGQMHIHITMRPADPSGTN